MQLSQLPCTTYNQPFRFLFEAKREKGNISMSNFVFTIKVQGIYVDSGWPVKHGRVFLVLCNKWLVQCTLEQWCCTGQVTFYEVPRKKWPFLPGPSVDWLKDKKKITTSIQQPCLFDISWTSWRSSTTSPLTSTAPPSGSSL